MSFRQKLIIGASTSVLLIVLIIASIKLFDVRQAKAADTGVQNPSAASTSGGTGRSWSNTNNIYSENGFYASVNLSSSGANRRSEYLEATGFGFSIPVGATIDGIEVTVARKGSANSSIRDRDVYLTKDGSSAVGTDYAVTGTNWLNTDDYATYGGSTDLWGTTWSVSEVNSANFGLLFQCRNRASGSRTAYVDNIQIKVYYTAAASNPAPGGVSSSIELWLDANNDVTGTTEISSWGDQSGNSNDMSITGSARPSLESSFVNGNNAIDFDGGDEYMEAAAGGYSDDVFVVLIPDNTVNYTATSQVPVSFEADDISYASSWIGLGSATSGLSNEVVSYGEGASGTWRRGYTSTTGSHAAGEPMILNVSNNDGSSTTSIYYNQTQIANSSNGSYTTAENNVEIRVGGNTHYWGGSYYDGKIAEVITYSSNLSANDRNKVAAYLAVKYGVTLQDDYVLSDGTVVWDETANSSYHNDVAGIVKDEDADLEQLSSKSENNDAVVTMSASSFDDDLDAIIWGNDNGTLSKGTGNGGSYFTDASNRTWKVETNETPSGLSVSFDLSAMAMTGGSANDYAILIDSDTDFSNATEHTTGASLNSNIITFTGVSFSDGYYFTLGQSDIDPFPGGVSSSIEMWLKADAEVYEDAGTDLAEDNDDVLEWGDQSGFNFDVEAAGSSGTRPNLRNASINFNPSIHFTDDGNRHLASSGNPVDGDMTWYVVYQSTHTDGSGSFWTCPAIVGAENSGTTNDYTISHNAGKPFFKGTGGNNFGCASTTNRNNRKPVILGATRIKTSATGTNYLYINGGIEATYAADNNTLSDPSSVGIGNHDDPISGSQYKGKIAEVINFSIALGDTDRYKIETYLAVKYGMSLDHVYLNTTGDTIWDNASNSAFHNRITGIGRDDETGLDQRQSRNVENTSVVTVAHGSIAATNQDNGNSFSTNKSFLIVGDDAGDLTGENETDQGTTTNAEDIERRIERAWKVEEVGTVGSVRLKFDLETFPGVIAAGSTYDFTELRLLVDADGVFASGAYSVSPTTYTFSSSDTSIVFDYNFPVGTSYFSLGTLDEAGSPLPVDWTHFDANAIEGKVELNWGTATETNNEYFQVQRSIDLNEWENLERLEGAGTTLEPQEYIAYDNSPINGIAYYRVKQTDFDGTTDYTQVRQVDLSGALSSNIEILSAYPNPFIDQVFIDVMVPNSGDYTFELLNSSGVVLSEASETIYNSSYQKVFSNLGSYKPGVYFVRVRNEQQSVITRVIKY
ncbi:MAG: T9SS type A sorting domain-containing protein [Bacteroidia bacterium]